ncbi:MAG: VWA domain-containing protein [bacterium]
MFFALPKLLWLLAIPVTLAFWEWIRRGQAVVVPVDFRTARRGRLLRGLIQAANMLPAALLAAAIILLARPMKHAPPLVERQLTNIQIVMDISPSMSAPYGSQPSDGPRYRAFDAEMDSLAKFLTHRRGDAFGLTVYAKHYIHWVPLTLETSAIINARPFIQPWDYGIRDLWQPGFSGWVFGGTCTFNALEGAADVLTQRAEGDRMVLFLTDGGHNVEDGSAERISRLIARYQAEHITCYGVFVGADEEYAKVLDENRFCRETGGVFFQALDAAALDRVFASIDEMKKVRIKTREARASSHNRPFLLPALGLLAAHLLALLGLRYTPW